MTVGARLGSVLAGNSAAEIWCAWVHEHADAVPELASTMLSESERDRMGQYRNVDAAARYVITRSLVRGVLSHRLKLVPSQVDVRVTDLGKPIISDELHFNVSHSGDLIMMAISEDRAVGIDVERRREVKRVGALITRWLTEGERDDVASLLRTGRSESDAFLRVWSSKEARLKALGVGISGATSADLSNVVAMPLDELLSRSSDGADDYVGAVAFA